MNTQLIKHLSPFLDKEKHEKLREEVIKFLKEHPRAKVIKQISQKGIDSPDCLN